MFFSFYREIKEGRGPIYMDATEISEERYYELEHVLNSNILERLRAVGVNPKKERFQWIAPAVHDFLGGARIDANCQTSIPGLYVAGESAGGIYGATRCGDYLTACAVFGFRAGKNAAEEALRTSLREAPWKKVGSKLDEVRKIGEKREGEEPESVRKNIKEIAGKYLSIEREEEGLKEAVKQFERIMGEEIYRVRVKDVEDHIKALELRNLSLTGRLIAEAALRRRETRGHHHRTDYPKSDDAWLKWIILKKDGDKVKVRYEDIPYKIP
jgi:fumarate reductase (CoM/CoB) subunit A